MTTYEVLSVTSSNPSGIGQYSAGLTYMTRKPRWGILPVKKEKRDLLTYRVYVNNGKTIAEERSLMTRDLGCNIPIELRKKILEALVEAGHIDKSIL